MPLSSQELDPLGAIFHSQIRPATQDVYPRRPLTIRPYFAPQFSNVFLGRNGALPITAPDPRWAWLACVNTRAKSPAFEIDLAISRSPFRIPTINLPLQRHQDNGDDGVTESRNHARHAGRRFPFARKAEFADPAVQIIPIEFRPPDSEQPGHVLKLPL